MIPLTARYPCVKPPECALQWLDLAHNAALVRIGQPERILGIGFREASRLGMDCTHIF